MKGLLVLLVAVSVATASLGSPAARVERKSLYEDSGAIDYGEYVLGSSGEYVRGGRLCMSYIVLVDRDAEEYELRDIFHSVTRGDGYFLHTVFFVDDERYLDSSIGGFARMEETLDEGFVYEDTSYLYDQLRALYEKE